MRCPHPRELSAHLDGESGLDRGDVEVHVTECARCRVQFEEFSALRPWLARAYAEHSENDVVAAVRGRTTPLPRVPGKRPGHPYMKIGAVAAAVLGALAWFPFASSLPPSADPVSRRDVRAAALEFRQVVRATFADPPILEVRVQVGPWLGGGEARVRYGSGGRFVAVTEGLFGLPAGDRLGLAGATGRVAYAGCDGERVWTYRPRDRTVRVRALPQRGPGSADGSRNGLAIFNWVELREGLARLAGDDVAHRWVREETLDGALVDVLDLASTSSGFGPLTARVWVRRGDLAIVQARVSDLATLTFARPDPSGSEDYTWASVAPRDVAVEQLD